MDSRSRSSNLQGKMGKASHRNLVFMHSACDDLLSIPEMKSRNIPAVALPNAGGSVKNI